MVIQRLEQLAPFPAMSVAVVCCSSAFLFGDERVYSPRLGLVWFDGFLARKTVKHGFCSVVT